MWGLHCADEDIRSTGEILRACSVLGTVRRDVPDERWQGVALDGVVLRGGISAGT